MESMKGNNKEKHDTPNVEIITHRTGTAFAPENSIAGLKWCIEQGFDWAEIDLRQTIDNHIVLLHDDRLDRTTDGTGRVNERTLEYISSLKLLQNSAPGAISRHIPTLAESIQVAKNNIRLYLDCRQVDPEILMKELWEAEIILSVMLFVHRDLEKQVRSLPGGEQIRIVRYFDPDTETLSQALTSTGPMELEVRASTITGSITKTANQSGSEVTCIALGEHDTPESRLHAIKAGARRIMTDFPLDLKREIASLT